MATATKDKKIIKAKLGFLRQTARKVRRTANLIREMKAGEASTQLSFMAYAAAHPLNKLLKSAMANAKDHGIENPQDLYISQLLVDDGPMFKRWRAASRGRAHSIHKRTSQLSIVLSEMNAADYAAFVKETSPRNKKGKTEKAPTKAKTETKKPAAKKTTTSKAKKPAAKSETKKTETKAKKPAAKKTTTKKSEDKK